MRSRTIRWWLLFGALALTGNASAQNFYTEGSALEFRTDLPWARLELLGHERIQGVSPLRIPGALDGDYWLRASGPGVETQMGRVRIRVDEQGTRILSYGRGPLRRSLLPALYPGLTQYLAEKRVKGLLFGLTAAGALGTAVVAQTELWDADSDLTAAERSFDDAANGNEQHDAQLLIDLAREKKTAAADRRSLALMSGAAIWGLSFIDSWILGPGFDVSQADEASLALEMRPRQRFDAVTRSILFPGLGQEYNGQSTKAFLLATGGIALGSWVFVTQDRYNQSVSDYELERIRWAGAGSVAERMQREAELLRLFDTVDDRKRERKFAVTVAAGYWALNVIDAAFSFGSPWGERSPRRSGFGFSVDPGDGSFAANLRF
ncbi:MAG: hypothetical protein KC591_04685 [Gemmatimonadetes bacterium]|nr:hypothetical protein [Gemmatimonadota bacterium]